MSGPIEQIGHDRRIVSISRKAMKWAKRTSHKYWRRMAKRLLDDAPKRREYKGYLG